MLFKTFEASPSLTPARPTSPAYVSADHLQIPLYNVNEPEPMSDDRIEPRKPDFSKLDLSSPSVATHEPNFTPGPFATARISYAI